MMNVQLWVCWLMLTAAASADVGERLTMTVSPAQSFAPTTLAVSLHVKPDAENRALQVVAESGNYYRSSRIQLDGNEAPKRSWWNSRAFPAEITRSAELSSTGPATHVRWCART